MIKEDYCSDELSELLKKKGMNKSCFTHYVQKNNNDGTSEAVSVCTHQMAIKWLREVHNILIWFSPVIPTPIPKDETVFYWEWEAKRKLHSHPHVQNHIKYKTYEEAVEASLKYCLTELAKGGEE